MDKETYNEIFSNYDQGKYKEILLYKKNILSSDYNQDMYEILGWSYMRLGKYESSIDILGKVYDGDKNSRRALYGLATSYFNLEKFQLSILFYKRFLKKFAEISISLTVEIYNNIGIGYLHMKKFKNALLWYTKALEIDPKDSDLYNNIGMVYHYLGDNQKALEYFEKGYTINPNDIDLAKKIKNTKAFLNE